MMMNYFILLGIALNFLVFRHAEVKCADDFTGDQYSGLWYDMGRISRYNESSIQPCNMHEVIRNNNNRTFYHTHIKLHNIVNCEHGVPIYTYTVPEEIKNSRIISFGSTEELSFESSVMSYNDGKELIFIDKRDESSAGISYRLWSRERHVSEETKAEFEKLIGDGTVTYHSWDHCPKLSTQTENEFTLKQFEGNWHSVSDIVYGSVINNDANVQRRVIVNYVTQTFLIITTTYGRHSTFIQEGRIVGHDLYIKLDHDRIGDLKFFVISCSNGTELILCQERTQNCGLMSRHKVSSQTRLGFEEIAKIVWA